jgi:transposase-like protein
MSYQGKNVRIQVPDDVDALLTALAKFRQTSRTGVVRQIVTGYLRGLKTDEEYHSTVEGHYLKIRGAFELGDELVNGDAESSSEGVGY